jgi:hypothetical protein
MSKKRRAGRATVPPVTRLAEPSRKKGGAGMSASGRAESEGLSGPVQAGNADNLDQVREILFGSQHRELARRLARMDAHSAAQVEELRGESRRRLEALEQHVNKGVEALAAAMEATQAAQRDTLASHGREAREAVELLEQRVKRLEEISARSQRELRQLILDQAKSFIDETRRVRDEIGALLDRELGHVAAEPTAGEPAPEGEGRREPWEPSSEAA